MKLQLGNITFDCDDVAAQASFWSQMLDAPVGDGAMEFFAEIRPEGGPNYLFIKVPEAKTAKNRTHVDFHSDDAPGIVAKALELGATKVGEYDEWGVQWATLQDPEGNEFCVAANPVPTPQ